MSFLHRCESPDAEVNNRADNQTPLPASASSHSPESGVPGGMAHSWRALAGPARQLRLDGVTGLELLGEPDEKSFGAADVAEPIRLFVLNHLADELRATRAEPD